MTKPKRKKHKKPTKKIILEKKDVFLYQDDLNGCEEYINSNFFESTQALYRWTKTPTKPSDLLPQYYLKKEGDDVLGLDPTVEERVERNTVSMYTSEEASRIAYNGVLIRLDKKDKQELNDSSSGHKAEFIDRCGPYVSKFNLTAEDALVGKENKRGHVNVILKRRFDFDKCLDQDFGTKKILEDEV